MFEEELEKAQDTLSKQQLKEQQHKEKIQGLLEKADPFRVGWTFDPHEIVFQWNLSSVPEKSRFSD